MCFHGRMEKNNIYKNNFVPPWPDDLGVSIGATLLANKNLKIKKNFLFNKFGDEVLNNWIEK